MSEKSQPMRSPLLHRDSDEINSSMAKDSEKKFSSIMNKLFQPPKSTLESTPTSRGKKRDHVSSPLGSKELSPNLEVAKKQKHLSSRAGSSDVPLCRPWDRDDLMKRLGTFKSISWFAKPKVISAVNCARRGWINVDMDMIACESCRSRLLFSTPSSWNQQQVENAALVFSSKLENGHKSLCPWIDNACDEALADFPPTPTPTLIEKFNERCLKLVCVPSLPVISPSTIEYMRTHPVEEFLEITVVPEVGDGSSDSSEIAYLRKEYDTKSAKLYYQALKLISLCGWEPRSLPYVVDFKNLSNHLILAVNTLEYGKSPDKQSTGINDSKMGDVETSCGPQPDGSIVLDCKLCGASIGLWTFRTVPKPLPIVRLVVSTTEGTEDESGADDSCDQDHVGNLKDASLLVSSDENSSNRSTSLNTTIAGGPPPTRQNFRARISLPLANRAVGAWLKIGLESEDNDTSDETVSSGAVAQITADLEEMCRRVDAGMSGQQLLEFLDKDFRSCGSPKTNDLELSLQNVENILQGSRRHVKLANGAEKELQNVMELEPGGSQIIEKENQISDSSSSLSSQAAQCSEISLKENKNADVGTEHGGSSSLSSQAAPCSEISFKENKNADIGTEHGDYVAPDKTVQPKQGTVQEGCATKEKTTQISTDIEPVRRSRASFDKSAEFDPIKQHRYFCPWIASTKNGASGWEQTISAITRKKEFRSSLPKDFLSSPSIIKVDDPVMSVRNLFTLSAKKLRQSLASNKTT